MIRVYDGDEFDPVDSEEFADDLVWEALRRGILEQIKVMKVRTSWEELVALKAEMAGPPPEQAALEGGDVPDEEGVK